MKTIQKSSLLMRELIGTAAFQRLTKEKGASLPPRFGYLGLPNEPALPPDILLQKLSPDGRSAICIIYYGVVCDCSMQ